MSFAPKNSSEWAAWVQACGSILALVVSVGTVWYQNRQLRTGQREHAARLLSGRLDYPKRLATSDGATWVLNGQVVNRSEAMLQDVIAEVIDSDGCPLPLPPLYAPAMDPSKTWHLRWAVGWKPECGMMLPFPNKIASNARLQVRLTFLDVEGHRWRRWGSHLEKTKREEVTPPPGSAELSKVLQVAMFKKPEAVRNQAGQMTEGILPNLRQALTDHAEGTLPDVAKILRPDQVADLLNDCPDSWRWISHLEGGNNIHTLVKAYEHFGRERHASGGIDRNDLSDDGLLTGTDPADAILKACDQVCSIMTALKCLDLRTNSRFN